MPSRPQRPLIRLNRVGKTYQSGTVALADVDLTVVHGEFVSLLGPSGCGKSTLLRLIAGLGTVSAGTIDWPQSTYDARGEPVRDLGFVFQEPTLMPWATVIDNIYLPLKLAGIARRAAMPRVEEALAMVKLERFAHAYPRELSGGMKMRVSIARALVVGRGCCSWTSRSPRSTRSPASTSTTTCCVCGRRSAGP